MKPTNFIACLCFGTLAFLTGCVGYNTALFMTKSNAGLDFDAKPPTMELNISRKEGVVEPAFEGGKTPPVLASFGSKSGSGGGLGRFFFGVDQTFAGGDAAVTMAILYNVTNRIGESPNSDKRFDSGLPLSKIPEANKQNASWISRWFFRLPEPGEIRPFFFGTDSQLGVKVGWNGVGGPYPDNIKIGYNRKEISVAPVTFTRNEIGPTGERRTNVVRIPSFLATVATDVKAGDDIELGWMQYFATGDAARFMARQYGVREAMLRRMDPAAIDAAEIEIQRTEKFANEDRQKRTGEDLAAIDELSDTVAINLATNPPVKLDADLNKLTKLRDPDGLRATDPAVARQMLKFWRVMGQRDDEASSAWGAAIKSVESNTNGVPQNPAPVNPAPVNPAPVNPAPVNP